MTRAERVLAALLAITALLAPVFLGGVAGFRRDPTGAEPSALERFLWADGGFWTLFLLASAVAAASLVVAHERQRAGEAAPWRLHGALLLPFAGLLALALLHALPMPRAIHGLLSPRAAAELDRLLPGDDSWRPLTISPAGTRLALLGLVMGGAVLLGTLLAARRRAAAWWLAGAVVAAFAGSAAYGLWQQYGGGDRVLEFAKRPGVGVTGTFLNRSHMAAGAGMALATALTMTGCTIRTRGARAWGLLLAGAAVLLAVTIPLTRSRMGLASAAVGVVVTGILAARAVRWPGRARALLVVLALGAAGGGVAWAVAQVPALKARFALGVSEKGAFDIRFPAWEASLRLASRYPVLGTGLGSYEVAIHETQTAANPDELVYAHSEPLHLLAEGGVVGLFLGALLAAGAVAGVLRAAASDDSSVRMLGCGCGGALAVVLVGSLTEFHLHIPALGIAAAILAAIPWAISREEPGTPEGPASLGRLGLAVVALAAAAIAVEEGMQGAAARGEAVRAEQARNIAKWPDAAARWVRHQPGDAAARRSLAMALLEEGAPGPLAARAESALSAADRAVDLEPFHPFSHWTRAVALLALERTPDAAAAIDAALSRAGGIGHLHLAGGSVLLQISIEHPDLRPRALAALREAGRIVPQHFSKAWALADSLGLDPEEREALAPDRAYAWRPVAAMWRERGDAEREVRAWARLASLDPADGSHREECLRAARAAGIEALALRLLDAP